MKKLSILNLRKKFSYHNIRGKIKKIIMKAGENDYYPSLFPANKKFYKSVKILQNKNKSRINFWSNLAKKHPTFLHFYEKYPQKSFIHYSKIDKSSSENII